MPDQHRFLARTMKGWGRAWKAIADKYGDPACFNSQCGESWQYMGTENDTHVFRHRALPAEAATKGGQPEKAEERVYAHITVQPDDFELDFDAYNGVNTRSCPTS